jgi:hypothetical protein
MHLHYMAASDFPNGKWQQHALSPLSVETTLNSPVLEEHRSIWSPRTSGNIARAKGKMFRFAPDPSGKMFAWEIIELSPSTYRERVWTGIPGSATVEPVFGAPNPLVDTELSIKNGAWRQKGIDCYDAHPRTGVDGQWLVFVTGLAEK